jgi:hypothetical protein
MVVERSLEVLADALGFDVVELWENDDVFQQQHRCLHVFTNESIKQEYPDVPTEPYLAS